MFYDIIQLCHHYNFDICFINKFRKRIIKYNFAQITKNFLLYKNLSNKKKAI